MKSDSPWSNVKIIDAQTFEEWIENTPAVETWLQEQGIGPSPSVCTLKRAWENWSQTTNPPVAESLVLAGREQATADFRNTLIKPESGPVHIKADSSEEGIAFVYSVIESTDDELFKAHQMTRSLVVRKLEDTARFKSESKPQCIILSPPATGESLSLARYGHSVISVFGNSSQVKRIDFKLNRADRSDFTKALEKMSIPREEAEIEARACGNSPSIWRVWNLFNQGDPSGNVPEWAKQQHAILVVPAILLGGWSDRSEGDRQIVETITGMQFEKYRDALHPFINSDNPLLAQVDDAWVVTAPATAFALIVGFITQGQLESFAEIVNTVFKQIDPSIDVPPDDRPYLGLRDIGFKHSSWLRNGLSESLLRITVLGKSLEENGVIPKRQNSQHFVDSLIKVLPGLSADRRLIESLREQLPVLMEAAPVPFINALESLLQGQLENVSPIFAEGEGIFSHAHHTGLLWGLETLAWDPDYLGPVSLILARLAEIDPGGKLSNRPINSLKEIFLAWHPGTSAILDIRLKVIDLIIDRVPEVAWDLLCSLMPKTSEVSSPTNEPIWKEFGRNEKRALTNRDVFETYQQYISRAIKLAGMIPLRWNSIVESYGDFSDAYQKAVEQGLKNLSNTDIPADQKYKLWETLRNYINRNEEFKDAFWALSSEKLDSLKEIAALFEPDSFLDKIAWLFDDYFPDIPFPKDDFDKAEEELKKMRSDAINNLLMGGGIESLKKLINKVSFSSIVASFVIQYSPKKEFVLEIIAELLNGTENEQYFVRHISEAAFNEFSDSWTQYISGEAKKNNWTPKNIANVFLNYPDSIETFALIRSFGLDVTNEYWEQRPGWLNPVSDEARSVAIDEFVNHDRPLVAINIAARKWSVKQPQEYFPILDSALGVLHDKERAEIPTNIGYWIEKLFTWLSEQSDVDRVQLAHREYAYLPLLTKARKNKDLALHEALSNDPKFFIDVICDLFKPTKGYPEGYQPPEDSKLRAEYAFKMLSSWKLAPGVNKNRELDVAYLKEWVNTVRQLAVEKDRVEIVDQYIGKILYYLPSDPEDGFWPHRGGRELLEDLSNANIEKGIEIEQHNSRGVVSKALFEGGKQEYDLARQWNEKARQIGSAWPRTKSMLEKIASNWESRARWEDTEAQKDRLMHL